MSDSIADRLRAGPCSGDPVFEEAADKIDGLEEDLRSAVEVAWRRGAETWVRNNYPAHVARLERAG